MRTFLIAILLPVLPALQAAPKPLELKLAACLLHLRIPQPAKVLRAGDGWVILRRSYAGQSGARMILRCKTNAHHTSLISDLRDIARKRLHVLRYYREIKVDRSVPAVYYLKSRLHRGRRIVSVDGYFATRQFEYNFNLIPDKRPAAGMKLAQYEYLVGDLGAVLRDLRFTQPVRPAITEAAYRRRVNWLIFAATAMGLSVAVLFFMRYRRRKAAKKKRAKGLKKRAPKDQVNAGDADHTDHEADSRD